MRPILGRFSEPCYALMRIVVGFLFACHGSQALLHYPPPAPKEVRAPAPAPAATAASDAQALPASSGTATPAAQPPPAQPRSRPPLILVGKVIELVAGLLIVFGFQTSIAAFLSSGQMAVAYFMSHAKGGFFPIVNRGELAVLYCFIFLFMAAKGSGIWSLDSLFRRAPARP